MVEIGYTLSSEEHSPNDLVRYAQRAEEVGFTFAFISDHYHPWVDRQGQSPFVWSVLGAIAHTTSRLRVSTGVTCPTMRIHPAIIAQAAATVATMMPGRFILGVGSGENLNEHILGNGWPLPATRLEMLEEAIGIIRRLWRGDYVSYRGFYYMVEKARIYTRPDQPPPILVAAKGQQAASLAGRVGDGLIGTKPDAGLLSAFEAAGGRGKPKYGQMAVCWASNESEARRIVHEWWPNMAMGEISVNLATPAEFQEVASLVREEDVNGGIALGPDPERHIAKIREYIDAGYDHIYIHQIGPDQEGFCEFYAREVLPQFGQRSVRTGALR